MALAHYSPSFRPDTLDPALLRPGRLDRRVEFGLPDNEGRAHILRIHARRFVHSQSRLLQEYLRPLSMSVERDIRFDLIARLCPNSTGAELRSVATEAGMFAIRARRKVATERDFLDAVEKVIRQGTKFSSTYVLNLFFGEWWVLTRYYFQARISSVQLVLFAPTLYLRVYSRVFLMIDVETGCTLSGSKSLIRMLARSRNTKHMSESFTTARAISESEEDKTYCDARSKIEHRASSMADKERDTQKIHVPRLSELRVDKKKDGAGMRQIEVCVAMAGNKQLAFRRLYSMPADAEGPMAWWNQLVGW